MVQNNKYLQPGQKNGAYMQSILLYDTTLRDGAQGENISFTAEDKLRLPKGWMTTVFILLKAAGLEQVREIQGFLNLPEPLNSKMRKFQLSVLQESRILNLKMIRF